MSRKKKKQAPKFFLSRANVILGVVLILVSLLTFFSKSDYTFGKVIEATSEPYVKLSPIKESTESAKASLIKVAPTPESDVPVQNGKIVRVPILTYHYIGNNPDPTDTLRDNLLVSPENFEEQMKYLAENGYSTISFETLYASLKGGELPAKPVILTFDDGYIDFYLNAYPVLKKYNLKAISFIPTGLMEQGYYLSWSQIKEMDASGVVIFEAHSVNHADLASLAPDQLKFELTTSKAMLQDKLGKPINFMAYPYGFSSPAVWNAVKEAGYMGAVGTWAGREESEGVVFNMPRVKIGNYNAATFASVL